MSDIKDEGNEKIRDESEQVIWDEGGKDQPGQPNSKRGLLLGVY